MHISYRTLMGLCLAIRVNFFSSVKKGVQFPSGSIDTQLELYLLSFGVIRICIYLSSQTILNNSQNSTILTIRLFTQKKICTKTKQNEAAQHEMERKKFKPSNDRIFIENPIDIKVIECSFSIISIVLCMNLFVGATLSIT